METQIPTQETPKELNSFRAKNHIHEYTEVGNYLKCKFCDHKKLILREVEGQELRVGKREDGKAYSVRDHRHSWFNPEDWEKLMKVLKPKQVWTAEVLIQTGARINEARHIMAGDCDFERNTIRLRVTKTKATKGERKGKPRTIPMDSKFMKRIRRHFEANPEGYIGILSTPAFNIALKGDKGSERIGGLQRAGIKDPYLYSTHNIRKTHGNWLKIMGNLGLMEVDAMEICLRLGHDYNTFLKDYGSSGVLNNQDILIIRKIFFDLYQR